VIKTASPQKRNKMTKHILKTILAGILAGAALFIMPFFLLRILVFVLIIGAVIRLLGGGRHRCGGRWRYAYAEKLNNMSEEERAAFKQKMQDRCGRYNKPATEQ
jgi:hypothetical protein